MITSYKIIVKNQDSVRDIIYQVTHISKVVLLIFIPMTFNNVQWYLQPRNSSNLTQVNDYGIPIWISNRYLKLKHVPSQEPSASLPNLFFLVFPISINNNNAIFLVAQSNNYEIILNTFSYFTSKPSTNAKYIQNQTYYHPHC